MKFRDYINLDLLQKTHGLDVSMTEAIINPEKINIKSTDLEYLRNKFKDIEFTKGELGGGYDAINDKISISIDDDTTTEDIAALIGHESIHRIQHKKSNGKYLEQSMKLINNINNLAQKIDDGISTDMESYDKLLSKFLYGSAQEKMTYAYQFVKLRNDKEYKFKSPDDIIKYIKKFNDVSATKHELDKKFKKYIGMYWTIKDII